MLPGWAAMWRIHWCVRVLAPGDAELPEGEFKRSDQSEGGTHGSKKTQKER